MRILNLKKNKNASEIHKKNSPYFVKKVLSDF